MNPTPYLAQLEAVWNQRRNRRQPWQPIDRDTAQDVLAEYGLTTKQACAPLISSGTTANMAVDTVLGRLVLKRYKASLELCQIIHAHSILMQLAKVDFPAPRLLPTPDGRTFVRREGVVYALFIFLEGYIHYPNTFLPRPQARQCVAAAGETMACLHDALQDFMPEGCHPNAFQSLTGPRTCDLAWYEDCLARCIEDTYRLDLAAEASGTLTTLLQRADEMIDTFRRLEHAVEGATPPRLIIHGDFGPHNLLFKRCLPPVVIDFEGAHLDWRIADLARAMRHFSWNSFGVNINKMNDFLGAYETRHPIADDELQLIPAVWRYFSIRWIINDWHRFNHTRDKYKLGKIRRHLQWMDWEAEHGDDVLETLASCRSHRRLRTSSAAPSPTAW